MATGGALLANILEKLEGKGCKCASYTWSDGKLCDAALSCIANVLLALVAYKSEVMLCFDDPETTEAVVSVFKKYLAADWASTGAFVAYSDDLLLDVLEIKSFHITQIENLCMVLKHCLDTTIQFAAGVVSLKHNEPLAVSHLRKVLEFIEKEDNIPSTPYSSGAVQLKEENTFLFTTRSGTPIQVGIPPETIKTSMRQGKSPPQVYVLPPKLMRDFGDINYGEVEFPIFFNFFVKKAFAHPENKVVMIGAADTLARVRVLLQESVFGPRPEHLHLDEDISVRRKAEGYWVDFLKERNFLAFKDKNGNSPPMEAFADFRAFDAKGEAHLSDVRLELKHGVLRFFDPPTSSHPAGLVDIGGGGDARSSSSTFRELPDELSDAVPVFQPPVLGVTFIGTSHGFDPKGRTTGFILWINGQGILVDPPVQTTEFLQRSGIHRRTVNKVILTHCHSDHDSGLLRKILEGEKIEVYTLKTIHESYKRKLQAITGRSNVGDYYTFRQVKVGEPLNINGAVFDWDFAFHTIPACRFKLSYKGKSIAYSADTYYNPQALALLTKQGTMNAAREIALRMWLFDADLIIHEAGVPPIHTDLLDLNSLPTSTKKKLLVVHTACIPATADRTNEDGSKTSVPLTDLRIPKTGVQHTVVIPVGDYLEGYSKATRLFRMFCNVFYFRNLPPAKLYELFSACEEVTYLAGDVIITAGQTADTFYLIECGQVEVWGDHQSPLSGRSPQPHARVSPGSAGSAAATASPVPSCSTPQSPAESPSPARELLTSLVRGESFGEAALAVSGGRLPRVADVIAKTNCTLLALSARALGEILGPDGHLAHLPLVNDLHKVQKYRPFVRDVLGKSFLFKNLKSDQIELIAALIDEEESYPKDAVIFQQGQLDTSLYLIQEGSVRLSKSAPEDPSMVVEFLRLGVGQCFGELALITGLPRSASAITNETTRLLKLKRENFTQIMNEYQNIRFHVMGLVEHRLEETQRVDSEVNKRAASPYRRGSSTSNLLTLSEGSNKVLPGLKHSLDEHTKGTPMPHN